jgi:hypothetical protein
VKRFCKLLAKRYQFAGAIFLLTLLSPYHVQAETDVSFFPIKWDTEHWYFYTSVYTRHHKPKPEHVNDQNMLGVEAQSSNNWLLGGALFDNSFGQKTQYLYTGYKWDFSHPEKHLLR